MIYLRKFNEQYLSESRSKSIKYVDISQERYMKSYEIVEDYNGLGPGTIFSGDSGYIDTYEELVERLTDDISRQIPITQESFIEIDEYLTTFIKGFGVKWY